MIGISSLCPRICSVLAYSQLFESGSLLPGGFSVTKNNRSRCWVCSLSWLGSTSRVSFVAADISVCPSVCLSMCLSSSPLLLFSDQLRRTKIKCATCDSSVCLASSVNQTVSGKISGKFMESGQQPSQFALLEFLGDKGT